MRSKRRVRRTSATNTNDDDVLQAIYRELRNNRGVQSDQATTMKTMAEAIARLTPPTQGRA